jgi:hypothetical protein
MKVRKQNTKRFFFRLYLFWVFFPFDNKCFIQIKTKWLVQKRFEYQTATARVAELAFGQESETLANSSLADCPKCAVSDMRECRFEARDRAERPELSPSYYSQDVSFEAWTPFKVAYTDQLAAGGGFQRKKQTATHTPMNNAYR